VRLAFVVILAAAVPCTSTAPAAPTSIGSASTPAVASAAPSIPAPTPSPARLNGWVYEGAVRENAIDPRSVVLPDGSYRQVFSRFRSFDPSGHGSGAYYVTAISTDGLHWSDEGESSIGYLIPVRLADGGYLAFSSSRASLYSSNDAKTWKLEGAIHPPEAGNPLCGATSGMFSDVIVMPDHTFRAYYNCQVAESFNIPVTTVRSATSKDGLVWQKDPGVRIDPRDGSEVPRDGAGNVSGAGQAEHPRVVWLPDGTLKMFYHSLDAVWSARSVDALTWTNRTYEGIYGGDVDAIVLTDGRLRIFVNGTVGLPREFAGKTPGENQSRMVSYLYGPVPFRVSVPELGPDCRPCPVGYPAHFSVTVEGSSPPISLGAVGYAITEVHDLVRDSASPVQVQFSPSSGSPPFAANATITFVNPAVPLSMVVVADNGAATEVVPLRAPAGGGGNGGGAGTMPACQLGAAVPPGGCYVPGSSGPDGKPLGCAPPAAMPIDRQPPVCAPYFGH